MNFKEYFEIFSERAYHGSPHKIEATFSTEKMGTGHGAQSFGWGLYFAEKKSVAKDYVPSSFKEKYTYRGKSGNFWLEFFTNRREYEKASVWENILLHKSKHQVLSQLDPDEIETRKYVESLPEKLFAPSSGFLYTVELNVDKGKLLDWYAPLENQTQFIKNKLEPLKQFVFKGLNYVSSNSKEWNELNGKNVYRGLEESFSIPQENGGLERTKYHLFHKAKSVSLMLNEMGIKGIMYDDSESQYNSSSNTKNFVIFDPKTVTIIDSEV